MTYYSLQEWNGDKWRFTGTHFHGLSRMQEEVHYKQQVYPGAHYRIAIVDSYAPTTIIDIAPLGEAVAV